MRAFGARLMSALPVGSKVFLRGELGAGKTTLVQGALAGLGYRDAVPSPSFTLVETYEVAGRRICHCDLYRVGDPDELEALGLRDYFTAEWDCWLEWPQRGAGYLPQADLELAIEIVGADREVRLLPNSAAARQALESFR